MRKPTSGRRSGRATPALPPPKAAGKARVAARGAKTAAGRNGLAARRNGKNGLAAKSARGPNKAPKIAPAGRAADPDAVVGGSRGKYVYCIIEAPDPLRFGPVGI